MQAPWSLVQSLWTPMSLGYLILWAILWNSCLLWFHQSFLPFFSRIPRALPTLLLWVPASLFFFGFFIRWKNITCIKGQLWQLCGFIYQKPGCGIKVTKPGNVPVVIVNILHTSDYFPVYFISLYSFFLDFEGSIYKEMISKTSYWGWPDGSEVMCTSSSFRAGELCS